MTVGLIITSLLFGMRHGVDWDHIAAIADLSSTAATRRRGFLLSLLYAMGHAVVVFVLGALAILFGSSLPSGVDTWMSRVVGATLVGLGAWIIFDLIRSRREFRLRSRWMIVFQGAFAGVRRVRSVRSERKLIVDHDHIHEVDHGHAHNRDNSHEHQLAPVGPAALAVTSKTWAERLHGHRHHHEVTLPRDAAAAGYGNGTAAGIGMLHGVGVESPTQIAIFVASTSVAGSGVGVVLLVAWIAGLVLANSVLALLAGYGLLHAERNFAVYASLAVFVAIASVAMGFLLVVGIDVLPEIKL